MKRGALVLVISASAVAACQLVAGIPDRVLEAPDGGAMGSSSGPMSMSTSRGDGPPGGNPPDGAGSTGDPADGAVDGGASDGVADNAAAPTLDASANLDGGAATLDGPSDAGATETSSADAAFAGVPCSQLTNYLFCDDFDSVTDASTGWSWTAFNLDGGSVGLEQDAPATAPNDLLVVVPPLLGSNQLGRNLGTVGSFALSFDLRLDVDSLDQIPYVIVAQVTFTQPDGGTGSFNYALGSGAARQVQVFVNGAQTFIALPVPPVRQWFHATLAYDPASGVTMTDDGVPVGGDGGAGIVVAPGTGTLIVGDVYGTPPQSGTLTFSMDDVVLQGAE